MENIEFLRQRTEDRRPWTHLTNDIWDIDSEERKRRRLKKKKQRTRIYNYMLTKTIKIDNTYNPIDNKLTMHSDRNVQYRQKHDIRHKTDRKLK